MSYEDIIDARDINLYMLNTEIFQNIRVESYADTERYAFLETSDCHMKEIHKLNISTFYRAPFDNVKVSPETYHDRLSQIKGEIFQMCGNFIFFPILSHRRKRIISKLSRDFQFKKSRRVIIFPRRLKSANDKSSLLVESNRSKL